MYTVQHLYFATASLGARGLPPTPPSVAATAAMAAAATIAAAAGGDGSLTEAALDEDALGASSRGYLVGRVRSTAAAPAAAAETEQQPAHSQQGGDAEPVRVVCVVGLAHANGVLDRCAEALAGVETRSV